MRLQYLTITVAIRQVVQNEICLFMCTEYVYYIYMYNVYIICIYIHTYIILHKSAYNMGRYFTSTCKYFHEPKESENKV